jgi:hypothetical protein
VAAMAAAVAVDWGRAAGPAMAAMEAAAAAEDVVAGVAMDLGMCQYPGYGQMPC